MSFILVSCRSGSLMKRKYMDGYYFSQSGSHEIKDAKENAHKTNIPKPSLTVSDPELAQSCMDTIVLTNNKKIPCKVLTIDQDNICYQACKAASTTNNYIKNNKVLLINFNGQQKEYFKQRDLQANPLLQFGLISSGIEKKNGMAVFGYVMAMITSAFLIAASAGLGLMFVAFWFTLMMFLISLDGERLSYKIINGFGKVIGILYIALFIVGVILIIAVLASI